jgi:FAD/FMN-containing dehydrogenase
VHEFSVAWIDCVAKGAATGRGVYMAGDFAAQGPLKATSNGRLSVPWAPPVSLINRLSLRLFNAAYWRRHPERRTLRHGDYASFFYPLDGILHWNRIYGRRGFQQYQCAVPGPDAEATIGALLQAIASTGKGSFLAVLKRFGDRVSPGLLSFPRPGVTLALDFPNQSGLEEGLFRRLDAIVREAKGRLFPAKDAHMSARDFQHAYPEWERLEALRDPLLMSRFWRRVTR